MGIAGHHPHHHPLGSNSSPLVTSSPLLQSQAFWLHWGDLTAGPWRFL